MMRKTNFQSLHLQEALLAVGKDFRWVGLYVLVLVLMGLVFERQFDFRLFGHGVWENQSEENASLLSHANPLPRLHSGELGAARVVDFADAVNGNGSVERIAVNHGDSEADLVVGNGIYESFSQPDTTFSIKQPGEVNVVVFHNLGSDQMLSKSGDDQNGLSRAKQGLSRAPGVCREWMAAPKGKVHSELARNGERSAEMTGPDVRGSEHLVTDCYNQTLLSTVRYINPTQKADLSFGGLYYQDMPWYLN